MKLHKNGKTGFLLTGALAALVFYFFLSASPALAGGVQIMGGGLTPEIIGKIMFSTKVDERLCTEPPSKIEDFRLGPNTALIEPVVLATKFKYAEVQVIIRLFFGAVAAAIGYQIKKDDEPYIYDVGKKIIAAEIDEALAMKYTWNGENQIFEAIDSFFAARSERYSKKSAVDRRKLFNLVSEGPIYKTGTPVALLPAAAARGFTITVLPTPFPAGHPYSGYDIYMCGPRGVWYFRDAVRRNIDSIKADLLKEDAELSAAEGGRVSPDKVVAKSAELKTLAEVFKFLRANGQPEPKLADEKRFETSDIAAEREFESLKQNTGDLINTLKMSGYSVTADRIELYKKLWQTYSKPENE